MLLCRLCYCCIACWWCTRLAAGTNCSTVAVQGLVRRLLPEALDRTIFECSAALGRSGSDAFELETLPNKQLLVRGSSGVALAHGWYHYLKHFAGCHVSWGEDLAFVEGF